MANFSGAVKISDLNDFINPSQECVKPVVIERTGDVGVNLNPGTIEMDDEGTYSSVKNGKVVKKLEPVKITLNDCLACSGCITTAETILVSQQSQEELYKILRLNAALPQVGQDGEGGVARVVVVVSVSPPSRASLAAQYRLTLKQTASHLTHFFKSLGVDYVFDTTFANDLSIIQSCREFVERFRRKDRDKTALPMLASQCPGWICYAEKTHGSYILPHISRVKSPQQITGSLVKHHLAERLRLPPSQLYHVTVMPCYDKKLEASRPVFYNEEYNTRDVDCVLTTGEVLKMLESEQYVMGEVADADTHMDDVFPSPDSVLHTESTPSHTLYKHGGGSSGGYLDHITKYAAKELFDLELQSLDYHVLRNQDMQEVTVEVGGRVLLRMARAYGFRNIQVIVQKVKRGKCPYDYVEVMACPSGCNNGGGQIIPDDGETAKNRLDRVNHLYDSIESRHPHDNPAVVAAIDNWLGGRDSDKCFGMLDTSYQHVEKTDNLLSINW